MTHRQGPDTPVHPATFRLLNDQPIDERDDDLLQLRPIAGRLVELVNASYDHAPFTLGIYADWGMGKSSLMKQMQALLDYAGVSTVWFNAWTAERGDALQGLITSVLARLDPNVLRRLLRRLQSGRALAMVRLALFTALGPLGLGRVVDEIWRSMSVDARTRNEAREVVRQELRAWTSRGDGPASSRRLVVFVDDLDRCADTVVTDVFEAIKLYLDAPGIVFVIGCDRHAVESAAATGRMPVSSYLAKVVQASYQLPPPDNEQLETLVRGYAHASGTQGLFQDQVRSALIARSARNPRQIKRLINRFVLEYQLDDGWQRFGVVALVSVLLLQEFYPDFYRLLAQPGGVDPIDEFLAYWELRAATAGDEMGQPVTSRLSAVLERVRKLHPDIGTAPPRTLGEAREVLDRLERQVPEIYPRLASDHEFVSQVTTLVGIASDELRGKLRRLAPPVTAPGPREWDAYASARPRLDGLHVLWVDDDEAGNVAELDELSRAGAHVDYVHDYDALTRAFATGRTRPDAILSDIARYGDDERGFTDLEALRRERDVRAIPVIFYTGRVTPARRERVKQLDAHGVSSGWGSVMRWLEEINEERSRMK